MPLRIFILLTCLTFAAAVNEAAEPALGQTLKKIFATPTPTPHRKKKAAAAKKKSPTPTPTPKKSSTPREKESPSPSPTPSPGKKKHSPTPTPSLTASPHRKKKGSPSPQPSETATPSAPPSGTPLLTPSATPEQIPSPVPPKKRGAPNATLSPEQIKGFDNYPASVQRLLAFALELTTQNLDYKYGSADPANGGMDCSGFVYFILRQNGIDEVPRDSSEQYNWLRRIRAFEPVLSQKEDSFELENLKPGDLLFWTGTYSIERDPPITHAMIYLGREKKSGQRVMVGASDGRVYQGESRYGVSVFDFSVRRARTNDESKLRPTFIGYGHVPGVQERSPDPERRAGQ